MSKLFIEDTTLSAIGDAIRSKTGSSDLIAPLDMPTAIGSIETGGGGGGEVEPVVLTGECAYICAGDMASSYIKLFGDTVSTKKITNANYMFRYYKNDTIPFDINMDNSSWRVMASMFYDANIKELPAINNAYPDSLDSLFRGCKYLRNIPDDFFDSWNFSRCQSYNFADLDGIFYYCHSLRHIPEYFLNNLYGTGTFYSPYGSTFQACYALDEIVGLGVHLADYTSNMFSNTFSSCNRLKDIIFATDNGTPYVRKWSNQMIDLTQYLGWAEYSSYNTNPTVIRYNSGITIDKRVYDDATYQALKNDPDWFATDMAYCRYNHDSAVRTINSLPDVSSGTGNTIKFKGIYGSATDGGAINTLTEAEIAVAAAKGWTVSIA